MITLKQSTINQAVRVWDKIKPFFILPAVIAIMARADDFINLTRSLTDFLQGWREFFRGIIYYIADLIPFLEINVDPVIADFLVFIFFSLGAIIRTRASERSAKLSIRIFGSISAFAIIVIFFPMYPKFAFIEFPISIFEAAIYLVNFANPLYSPDNEAVTQNTGNSHSDGFNVFNYILYIFIFAIVAIAILFRALGNRINFEKFASFSVLNYEKDEDIEIEDSNVGTVEGVIYWILMYFLLLIVCFPIMDWLFTPFEDWYDENIENWRIRDLVSLFTIMVSSIIFLPAYLLIPWFSRNYFGSASSYCVKVLLFVGSVFLLDRMIMVVGGLVDFGNGLWS